MVAIYGYGEDSITYWAFNTRFSEIMNDLEDESKEESCLLFYRPSLGRGGKSDTLFGEFDAILLTPKSTYLIEAKWDGSNELKKGTLTGGQRFRHTAIKWIAENWNGIEAFDAFMPNNQDKFHGMVKDFLNLNQDIDDESWQNIMDKRLPEKRKDEENTVFNNLCFILHKAREINKNNFNVQNVVLVFINERSKLKNIILDFKVDKTVKILYKSVDDKMISICDEDHPANFIPMGDIMR